MRAFVCQRCRQLVGFEDLACGHCDAALGYDPATASLRTLWAKDEHWEPWAAQEGQQGLRWCRCRRNRAALCNWLVPAGSTGALCASCQLTRRMPDKLAPVYQTAFAKAEVAKRRLLYQLGQLGLPIVSRHQDPERGLAFDLLASDRHVVTGHDSGVITIDLNETDDVFREQARAQFGEPYRTLLGHFRHEIGHYYWQHLFPRDNNDLAARAAELFGDHREAYDAARHTHYRKGARPGWQESYVSAYASMHPFEDWAETFAHYLHIWDTVQTAGSFGVLVTGPVDDRTGRRDPLKASVPSEDTARLEGFDAVIADWRPLTRALNALNRSMGKEDLYPFELSPAVVAKLAFVHGVISLKARP